MEFYYFNKNLTELIIPDDIHSMYCHDNQLTELLIPDNLLHLYCESNNIKELFLNHKLYRLDCDLFVCVNNININIKDLTIMFF